MSAKDIAQIKGKFNLKKRLVLACDLRLACVAGELNPAATQATLLKLTGNSV